MFIARSYARALQHFPLATKCASGASLGGCGDVVAQTMRHESPGPPPVSATEALAALDTRRTLAFSVFGGGYTGAFNHFWLGWLSRRYSAPGLASVVQKQLWQHAVLNPFLFVPSFYAVTEGIRGRALTETTERVRSKYWETLYAVWSCWGPATMVMFAFVPERYQVLYTAAVSFGWNVVLSLVSNRGGRSTSTERD